MAGCKFFILSVFTTNSPEMLRQSEEGDERPIPLIGYRRVSFVRPGKRLVTAAAANDDFLSVPFGGTDLDGRTE